MVPEVWAGEAKQEYKELVNRFWIEDCLDAGEVLPISSHHVPLPAKAGVTILYLKWD